MIMQQSCFVVDCPICGRPVEVQTSHINYEVVCGHCHGHFVVHQTEQDGLKATRLGGRDLLARAEQLLSHSGNTDRPASSHQCEQVLERPAVLDNQHHRENYCETSPQSVNDEIEQHPTAIMVEDRDEVFARIATDMAKAGIRVVRAHSATEALKLCGAYEPSLVVANLDQPDQSGWLLAAKLRFVDRRIRVWLYQSQATHYGEGMAHYLHVDELLDYGGDLLGLSQTITKLMLDHLRPDNPLCDDENKQASATA